MTRSFILNKLVRDKIVQNMTEQGQHPSVRTLNDSEFDTALTQKLKEEVTEVIAADAQSRPKELADLLEVIETLADQNGIGFEALRALQYERRVSMGGFASRHFVQEVTLGDDDEWTAYYAADPTRFPEVES